MLPLIKITMEKTSQNQIDTKGTDYLIQEYNQCFSHMRHYDELKLSLAKFAFSFYSAIATVSFALERYFYYELIKGSNLLLSLAIKGEGVK